MIENLSISVNGKNLFVPYSVFADIVDPNEAAVKFKGKTTILSIYGNVRNASESYLLKIYFDSSKVNRRMLFPAILPEEPTQDTHYWLKVLE